MHYGKDLPSIQATSQEPGALPHGHGCGMMYAESTQYGVRLSAAGPDTEDTSRVLLATRHDESEGRGTPSCA